MSSKAEIVPNGMISGAITIIAPSEAQKMAVALAEANIDTTLGSIYELQNICAQAEQVQGKVHHAFSEGLYARTIEMPANSLIVAMRYKHDRMCIISKGTATIATDTEVAHYVGPAFLAGKAGTKRVIYTHTPVYMTTLFPTSLTDPDAILAENMHDDEVGAA
jgi:hypothetical protein